MNKLWKSKMRDGDKALPRPERKQPERKQKPDVVKSNKPESMDEVTKMMKELQIRQLKAQKRMDEELADGEDEDEDDSEDEDENNKFEEVMDADLTPARISNMENEDILINQNEEDGNDDMPDDLTRVKRYRSTLRRPDGITDRAFGVRRSKPNMPPKRVIWDKNKQNNIIQQMHDESGYRGKKGTYEKIALRYWWKGLQKEWG